MVPGSWTGVWFRGWDPISSDMYVAPGLGRSGGDEETRTPDPLLAKEMLSQLSYVPLLFLDDELVGGRFWTRTRDLCLIRAVL